MAIVVSKIDRLIQFFNSKLVGQDIVIIGMDSLIESICRGLNCSFNTCLVLFYFIIVACFSKKFNYPAFKTYFICF